MSDRLIETLIGSRQIEQSRVIHLLDGPYLSIAERRLEVPEGSKRLLVFVALSSGTVDRRQAAGVLWPLNDDLRAAGNLRSSLWRLRSAGIDVLTGDKCTLSLAHGTVVDVDLLCRWAEQVTDPAVRSVDLVGPDWRSDALDLLPGWYDDWVIFERERVRQRLLHALEALSSRLVEASRYAEAVESALAAVRAEPLRESAQRALIEAHLAEGNVSEARGVYLRYRSLLARELKVAPGRALTALVEPDGERRGHHMQPQGPSLRAW